MPEQTKKNAEESEKEYGTWVPTHEEQKDLDEVGKNLVIGRNIINKSYNQFNGRTLYDCIDDWTKRWNGYLPIAPTLTADRSNIFLNFTRNLVISFVSKAAAQLPDIKVIAVNKKTGTNSVEMGNAFNDLIDYSNLEENAQSKFVGSVLEAATKGTVIKYEGYMKYEQETEIPEDVDHETGEVKTKKETRVMFDNCYQENVFIEDFYIGNPYQPEIQKQPFIIWKKIQQYDEACGEFEGYENWKYVKPGNHTINTEPTTFYRNQLQTELTSSQVEVIRYYNKRKNKHIIQVNGIILYSGVIPRKDGNYPFAKGIHEPFGNDFFWGMALPQKIMGDQDLVNTLWNMMIDKTYGSLMPFGLSSDLDDLVEDTVLEPNKIRKVGDVNNWRFETLPGVNAGEQTMLQAAIGFVKENSGYEGGAGASTQKGGKVSMRQAMLKQQEAEGKLGFTMNYLEDFERDRTELRLNSIIQYYSIPKIEKVTGKSGKEIEDFIYRDITIPNVKLSDGTTGTKKLRLVNNDMLSAGGKQKIADEMAVEEEKGELTNSKSEHLALNVDSFYDYDTKIIVVKNSSYKKNELMDRAERMEFATWRLQLAQFAPCDVTALIKWVEESYDVDPDMFEQKQGQQQPMNPMQQMQEGNMPQPASAMAPGKQLGLDQML